MSEVVRLYRYKSLLSSRTAVSADDLMAKQEVSRATLKRDIAKLRDQLHVPIRFDRDLGGYTLEPGHAESELPGLWRRRSMFEFGTVLLYMFQFWYAAIEYQKSVRALVGKTYSAVSTQMSLCVMEKVGRYFRMPVFEVCNAQASIFVMGQTIFVKKCLL